MNQEIDDKKIRFRTILDLRLFLGVDLGINYDLAVAIIIRRRMRLVSLGGGGFLFFEDTVDHYNFLRWR